jgi:hypothetical protein
MNKSEIEKLNIEKEIKKYRNNAEYRRAEADGYLMGLNNEFADKLETILASLALMEKKEYVRGWQNATKKHTKERELMRKDFLKRFDDLKKQINGEVKKLLTEREKHISFLKDLCEQRGDIVEALGKEKADLEFKLNETLICGHKKGYCERCEIRNSCLHFRYGMMRRDISKLEAELLKKRKR